jgi:hypothetical protein
MRAACSNPAGGTMTDFASFTVSFGSLLALMTLIAAWLFRTASAPLWAKVAVPSLAVALGCYAPFAVSGMMGFPVPVGFDELPDHAELVAFAPRDAEKRVDLWLRTSQAPRAYEAALTEQMKKTLHQAAEEIGHGRPAVLTKLGKASRNKSGGQDVLRVGGDEGMYVLNANSTGLPPKE